MVLRRQSLALIAAILVVTALALCPAPSTADNFRFEIIQIGRFAFDRKFFSSRPYFKRKDGQLAVAYDEFFRHPFVPAGALVVDCDAAQLLGVSFQLRRANRLFQETVNWDVVWRHKAPDETELVERHSHQVIFKQKETQRLTSEFMGLWGFPEWRRDGIVTVQVKVRGRTLLGNAFEIIGCDGS